MNIFIYGANWYNRGDESAIRAMIDEIRLVYADAEFKIHFNNAENAELPYNDIEQIPNFIPVYSKNKFKVALYYLAIKSLGKINLLNKDYKYKIGKFVETINWADIIVYAPGGPMVGDLYGAKFIFDQLDMIASSGKPYIFYAPSMGPFNKNKRVVKKILKNTELLCFREAISQDYFKTLDIDRESYVTLDSAFQHPIDTEYYSKVLDEYTELKEFIGDGKNVIGITVTDLLWHSNYKSPSFDGVIKNVFSQFIDYVTDKGYKVLFIPQLFGESNDRDYMKSFENENCFTVSDKYDCYFQQYLISKLYAVVGMRYHSNIFSAKMGTPFISVSYEQKMQGFMNKAGIGDYCIPIKELSYDILKDRFEHLLENYDSYKSKLNIDKEKFRKESYKTTEMFIKTVKELGLK